MNRHARRRTAAIANRVNNRPGTTYTKRGASKAPSKRMSAQKAVILSMKQNDQVMEAVLSGALDKYVD